MFVVVTTHTVGSKFWAIIQPHDRFDDDESLMNNKGTCQMKAYVGNDKPKHQNTEAPPQRCTAIQHLYASF